MIEIEPATVGAFQAEEERRRFTRFVGWWRAHALPPADDGYLGQLWHYAGREALAIGIEDDERGQVSLYAAAFGTMGELDGHQFLQVADILFLDEPVDARLGRIGALARGGGAG